MPDPVPFHAIFRDDAEQKAILKALEQNSWHGNGPSSKRVEAFLKKWLDAAHVFLTTSCTHALEMAMLVLDIRPGDQVIMPSFTFVSTANAVAMRGATPVFSEIRSSDLTIDPEDVAKKITPSTRAIIPVHYAGVSVDFDALIPLAEENNIAIVEDAAQGVGAYWRGRALGTIGQLGCFSFHDTKNLTCGEGGALLARAGDIAEKAEWIREKGTNRSAFLRGEVDKYTWISPGSSYIPSDLLAALLEAQLEKKDLIHRYRKAVWQTYFDYLSNECDSRWITLPRIPEYAESNYHIFHLLVRKPEVRNPLLKALKQAGIEATFHYVPLHNAPYARNLPGRQPALKRTELLADCIVRLPLYPDLYPRRREIAGRICSVLNHFFEGMTDPES